MSGFPTSERAWRLAIDFGTTNTAAAYRIGVDRPQPVRLSEQADQMPSAVLIADGGVVVGTAAVRAARLDPSAFEACPKRRIGEGEILMGDAEFAVVDLVASVLHQVLTRAMRIAGGGLPTDVVLTYPQEWASTRQELLLVAASRAGFTPGTVRLLPEPVAAASWYASAAFGEAEPVPAGKFVAVFDFGGGTLDVAVLRADAQGTGFFRVVAADGIDPLGGEILDLRLQDWLFEQLREGGHRELAAELLDPENLGALQTLREQLRQAKHELSEYESARIPVVVGDRHTVVTVTAREFDRLVSADIDSAVELTRRMLQDAGVTVDALHAMYLTGGSSHLRLVHRRITELLGRSPATLNDPKLVVALGALTVPRNSGAVPAGRDSGSPAAHPPAQSVVPSAAPPAPPRPATPRPQAGTGPQPRPDAVGPTSGPMPRPDLVKRATADASPLRAAAVPKARRQFSTGAIIAAMAGVAAVLATTFILLSPRKDNTGRAEVGTTASPSAETTAGFTAASDPSTAPPTLGSGALLCWDGSSGGNGTACPDLVGMEAVEWVFPFKEGLGDRVCVDTLSPYPSVEVIEYYSCTYPDLPHSTVNLARWKDAAGARKYIDELMLNRTGAVPQAYDNGDAAVSAEVAGSVWSGSDLIADQRRFAFVYDDQPYSLELVISESDEFGVEELERWDNRAAQFRYASSVADRGTSRG